MAAQGLDADRAGEHIEIARSNGDKIIANPGIALDAITHRQATFTSPDLARFVTRHTHGKAQFDVVLTSVKSSPDLHALGKAGGVDVRFPPRSIAATTKSPIDGTQTN